VLDYSFHEIKNISGLFHFDSRLANMASNHFLSLEISDHDGSGQRNTAEEEQDADEKSKPKRPKSRTSGHSYSLSAWL